MNSTFHQINRWNGQIIKSLLSGQIRNRSQCYSLPVTFENVTFPPNNEMKLPELPSEPIYDAGLGEAKYKSTDRIIEARGYEAIHTELIHKQFGLRALQGGFVQASDLAFIRDRINRNLKENQFAIWRVDAPWLPKTKKAKGVKLGGGKGSLSHYVTPVREGRIIFELGGYIIEHEARAYCTYLAHRFQFPVEVVSQQLLDSRREFEQNLKANNCNRNKFDWQTVIKYNMQNCYNFLSEYDVLWNGKYR